MHEDLPSAGRTEWDLYSWMRARLSHASEFHHLIIAYLMTRTTTSSLRDSAHPANEVNHFLIAPHKCTREISGSLSGRRRRRAPLLSVFYRCIYRCAASSMQSLNDLSAPLSPRSCSLFSRFVYNFFPGRVGFQRAKNAQRTQHALSIELGRNWDRSPASPRILCEFRCRFTRKTSLSVTFSEGDAVPQIRPSLLQQSFNPRPRFAASRADVIHYSTRRCSCLRVLVADITFTRGHVNAYSHGRAYTCTRYRVISPVAVSENSRHRRSDARTRAHCPRQAILCNFSLDSPSLFSPSSSLSSPLCPLFPASLPSRLFCCCYGYICWYLFIHSCASLRQVRLRNF